MGEYPIKVRWQNDSEALNKFLTREVTPRIETPEDKRTHPKEDLESVAECVVGRQKTNIVIRNKREHELVIELLETFANGIGHPAYGGMWADKKLHNAVNRRIEKLTDDR